MKKIIAFAAMLLMTATAANAQFQWGVKAGVNITEMSLGSSALEASNNAGFFVGPTCKFTLPIVGLGLDVSAVYDQRSFDTKAEVQAEDGTKITNSSKVTTKNVAIPLNIRYNLFGIGQTAAIYVYGGPQIAFNVGDKNAIKGTTLASSSFSTNLGLGVMVLSRLQVNANYNIAMGKTGDQSASDILGSVTNISSTLTNEAIKAISGTSDIKSNSWQIGVAYYF